MAISGTLGAALPATHRRAPFAATGPAHEGSRTALRFTGSGSEYFRIWIVNLLLILLTVGLYYPWAKVRRLQYFHRNTLLGDHGFDFHGNPWAMLRGYVLVAVLTSLYSFAGQASLTAGLVAFAIMAAVWPALFRSAQQFRLSNTSWRGMRFRFTGSLKGAYFAMGAALLPVLLLSLVTMKLGPEPGEHTSSAQLALALSPVALLMLMAPLAWWLIKRYQHGHLALGSNVTRFDVGAGAMYGVFLRFGGLMLLVGLVGAAIVGRTIYVGTASTLGVLMLVVFPIACVGVFALSQAYFAARLQNLVWNGTDSDVVRFHSALSLRATLKQTLKNWLLIALTLGLYWPFAKVAMARLRLQAVEVELLVPVDALMADAERASRDAAGDAAGDLFGIDFGL